MSQSTSTPSLPLWAKYVLPMATFILLTTVESHAPESYRVGLYFAKACLVSLLLFVVGKEACRDMEVDFRVLPSSVVVGIAVFVMWVSLDNWIQYPHLGTRTAVNPFAGIESPTLQALFIVVRFYGLVVMVPIMEELFWRSFLLRYFTDADFTQVPHGSYSWQACATVALGFSLSHSEWLAALLTALAYAAVLRFTKSIFACIVAHGTTNACLGFYILKTGAWHFW